MERKRWALLFAVCLNFMMIVQGNCPDELPVQHQGICLGIQLEPAKHKDARDQCKKLHEKAAFAAFTEIPQDVIQEMKALIESRLQDTYWVGLEMKDNTMGGSLGDRKWTFLTDDSTVVQKDYELWSEEPSNGNDKCTVIDRSKDYRVRAVGCGSNASPVLCQKTGGSCTDSAVPYLVYGDYCFVTIVANLDYGKMINYCKPNSPAAIKDKDTIKQGVTALNNIVLGGASLIAVKKGALNLYFYDDDKVLSDSSEMWAEGEPRKENGCVGLFVNENGEGRLRTVNCELAYAVTCFMIEGQGAGKSDVYAGDPELLLKKLYARHITSKYRTETFGLKSSQDAVHARKVKD